MEEENREKKPVSERENNGGVKGKEIQGGKREKKVTTKTVRECARVGKQKKEGEEGTKN